MSNEHLDNNPQFNKSLVHSLPVVSGVKRQRLFKVLDKISHIPFILVKGPAGSGKSTLISQWRHQARLPHCLVNLDGLETDSRSFWVKVSQTLRTIHRPLSEKLLHHLEGPQPLPIESFIRLFRDMLFGFHTHFVLILDDFHQIEHPQIIKDLAGLIGETIPCLKVIVSTRVRPDFPLAKWEIAGKAMTLNWTDLQFNLKETKAFFDQDWSDDQIRAAWKLTEGWVSGLRLFAISGNEYSTPKTLNFDRKQLGNYLYQEVFETLPPDIQHFLLTTCLVDSFDLQLSESLTELTNCEELLGDISKRQLFLIPLNPQQDRYRFHHLFCDFLRNKIKTQEPEKAKAIHHRAAKWYFQGEQLEAAYHHAIFADSFDLAAQYLEVLADSLLRKCAFPLLLKNAQSLPESSIRQSPKLCLDLATAHVMTYQWHPYQKRITQLENLIAKGPVSEQVRAGAHILKANLARQTGRLNEASYHCKAALTLLKEGPPSSKAEALIIAGACSFFKAEYSAARDYLEACIQFCHQDDGTEIVYLGARALLGDLDLREGSTFDAARNLKATVHEIEASSNQFAIPMAAMIYVCYSDSLYFRNELETARPYLAKAQEYAEMGNLTGPMLRIYLAQCRLFRAKGQPDAETKSLSDATQLLASANIQKWQQNEYFHEAASFYLHRGDTGKAESHLAKVSFPINDEVCFNIHQELHLRLEIDLQKAKPSFNSAKIEQTLQDLKQSGQILDWIRFRILQVRFLAKQGELAEAFSGLVEIFSESEKRDLIRPILDGGLPIAKLVHQLFDFDARRAWNKEHSYSQQFLKKLFNLFQESHDFPKANRHVFMRAQEASPLTRRETEVLAIIAKGKSNVFIAEKLHVSMATLKTHINRIYAKLDIKSRAEAILKAQEIGLG